MHYQYSKPLLLLLAFLAGINSYSQNNVTKPPKKRIKVVHYYENGLKKEKGTMIFTTRISQTHSGRACGVASYFENGRWIEYYEDGRKKRKVKYKKGEIVKVIKVWKAKNELLPGNS